jgi:regulator of replication initiation timing
LACAAVNTVNSIDQKETEIKENVHGNVNENVQIDLSNEKIESSTDIDSVVAKIDSIMANLIR